MAKGFEGYLYDNTDCITWAYRELSLLLCCCVLE